VRKVWNRKESKLTLLNEIRHPEILNDVITYVHFMPVVGKSKPCIIACVQDSSLYVLEVQGYSHTRKLNGIKCIEENIDFAILPDLEHIIASSEDGKLTIFHVRKNEYVESIGAHSGTSSSVSCHQKLGIVASCGLEDRILRIWFPSASNRET